MHIYRQWGTSLMESAAHIRVENTTPRFITHRLKESFILLLDHFFAYFSPTYQTQRTQMQHRFIVLAANRNDTRPSVEKTDRVFQAQNVTSPNSTSKSVSSNFVPEQPTPLKTRAPQDTPSLILAAGGINQYQSGGPAACTLLACQFLASKLIASSEMLGDMIRSNTYEGANFLDTENCIRDAGLQMAENPWEEQREWSPTMQASLEREEETGMRAAIHSLLNSAKIRGAIITAHSITIGMRKIENRIEFFDSHGNAELTGEGNAAYIKIFDLKQREQIVDFLSKRFPHSEYLLNVLEIFPIA